MIGLQLYCSARPQSRARIETVMPSVITRYRIVAPGPKAGRGLKLFYSFLKSEVVESSARPQSRARIETIVNGAGAAGADSSARPQSRARIETYLDGLTMSQIISSARPQSRARIETSQRGIDFNRLSSSARPQSRARIETLITTRHGMSFTVAPGPKAGRGLKPQNTVRSTEYDR